ncbi:MAG: hypothetical protein JNM00_06620 [Flavobacteriales bacterium]|nr:hypothetical protein [Flavobacteriales bacterium]
MSIGNSIFIIFLFFPSYNSAFGCVPSAGSTPLTSTLLSAGTTSPLGHQRLRSYS